MERLEQSSAEHAARSAYGGRPHTLGASWPRSSRDSPCGQSGPWSLASKHWAIRSIRCLRRPESRRRPGHGERSFPSHQAAVRVDAYFSSDIQNGGVDRMSEMSSILGIPPCHPRLLAQRD